MGYMRNAYRILVGKPEGNGPMRPMVVFKLQAVFLKYCVQCLTQVAVTFKHTAFPLVVPGFIICIGEVHITPSEAISSLLIYIRTACNMQAGVLLSSDLGFYVYCRRDTKFKIMEIKATFRTISFLYKKENNL
jgi:hypothetical protein